MRMVGMGEGGSGERQALDPIAYLSRSENRLQVLEALTAEMPKPGQEQRGYDPRALRELTGASESTLSRILNEFQDREWVERGAQGHYTVTRKGQHIAAEFKPLVDSVETIQELGDAVGILPATDLFIGPTSEVSISRRHFRDATVREPTGWDPSDINRYFTELLEDVSIHRSVNVGGPSPEVTNAILEGLRSGRLTVDAVNRGSVVDRVIDHPEIEGLAEALEYENFRWYRCTEYIPCTLWVNDETVSIENGQVDEVQTGTVIESQNATVRHWAMELIDRYIETSEEVTVEDLPE